MKGRYASLLILLAFGCRDRVKQDVPHVKKGNLAASKAPTIEALYNSRLERIDRLGASCKIEDWSELVLIAANRHAWQDDLATREPRAASTLQCRAIAMLKAIGRDLYGFPFHGDHAVLAHRRVAAGLSRPDVIATLKDAISGKIRLPACPQPDDFASLLELAPLQVLRPAVEAHASYDVRDLVLSALDKDRSYRAGRREAQLVSWAAELTPDGFSRVLDALAPTYAWNDGAPPPSATEQNEIEQYAIDLIGWLGWLVSFSKYEYKCKRSLIDAVATGHLGALILARLAHPNPEIRRALLEVLAEVPAVGSRARVAELAATDPDPRVRKLAVETQMWIERGGMTNKRARVP